MTDLKALVERIEGAAKNDADLFREVATAVFGSVPDVMNRFLAAGAYLDAAMQLVPEWCFWALNMAGDGSGFDAMCQDDGPVKWTRAATPALALCAAALKSRAYLKETNNAD